MRRSLTLALIACAGLALADAPRIKREAIEKLEETFDRALVAGKVPCDLLGNTRGVYLEGYGAVFTSMVSLVFTPTPNPFRDFTKKDVADIHQKKLQQIPVLKEKMRDMLLTMAASSSLDSVRPSEQMVCGVTLYYYKWEDQSGLPSQIVMQAEKQKLLDVQNGRAARGDLDSIVKVQEF